MNAKIILPYVVAKPLINEGDVLLFRGSGWVAFFIGVAGESFYSHVAVASWHNGDKKHLGLLECVEFREGSFLGGLFNSNAAGGGRSVNLYNEVQKYSGCIDVYRPVDRFTKHTYNAATHSVNHHQTTFDGKAVTNTMRQLTGLPYGWKRIWWLMQYKLAIWRLISNRDVLMNDNVEDIVYPVCSTAVAYAFNKNNCDLINNKSDEWTEPADIARSARLSYLFTLST